MGKLFVILLSGISRLNERVSRDDEGATAVEYGLMVALIAVAIVLTVRQLGLQLDTLFNTVLTAIS